MSVDCLPASVIQALQGLSFSERLSEYKYKIAAVLFDMATGEVVSSASNGLPKLLENVLEPQDILGDSGPTIHAEEMVMQQCPIPTKGLAIAVTDPLCPNCMKSVLSSGIDAIYVAASGFDHGIWYNSGDEQGILRSRYFKDVSLALAKANGCPVFIFNDQTGNIKQVLHQKSSTGADQKLFKAIAVEDKTSINAVLDSKEDSFACAMGERAGKAYFVYSQEDYIRGMNDQVAKDIRDRFKDVPLGLRYRLMVDPLSGILSAAHYFGLKLKNHSVYISEIPTSRCLINAIGNGISSYVLASDDARSEKSMNTLEALAVLEEKAGIKYSVLKPEKLGEFLQV